MYVLSYLMPADQKMLVSPTASWLQLSGWSTQSSRSEVSEGECLQYCSIPWSLCEMIRKYYFEDPQNESDMIYCCNHLEVSEI